jgi:hypothetical protein
MEVWEVCSATRRETHINFCNSNLLVLEEEHTDEQQAKCVVTVRYCWALRRAVTLRQGRRSSSRSDLACASDGGLHCSAAG